MNVPTSEACAVAFRPTLGQRVARFLGFRYQLGPEPAAAAVVALDDGTFAAIDLSQFEGTPTQ